MTIEGHKILEMTASLCDYKVVKTSEKYDYKTNENYRMI